MSHGCYLKNFLSISYQRSKKPMMDPSSAAEATAGTSAAAAEAPTDFIPIDILTADALLIIFSYLTVWDKGRAAR